MASIVAALTRETPNGGLPQLLLQATKLVPGSSVRSISPLMKKKSLSRMSGPLNEMPDWR